MKAETLEYIRYRVSRAEAMLELATLALDNGFLYDAVNRLYYACFFAVSALLVAEGNSFDGTLLPQNLRTEAKERLHRLGDL